MTTAFDADKRRALLVTPVSRETQDRLERFVALLLQWQQTTNLIAGSTVSEIWTRHVADSLQLLPLAPAARVWVDLGSGGGFPGLPIACALAGEGRAEVHLVESNGKKAAFLREAVRATGAPAIAHAERIENFGESFGTRADVITARALAPLKELLGQVHRLMGPTTIGLIHKGQDVEAELTEASKYWKLDVDLIPSRTSPESRIVRLKQIEPLQRVA